MLTRHVRLAPVVCILAAALMAGLSAGGCAANLRDQAAQYEITLTAAVETLADLRAAGVIDDEEYGRINLLVEEAYITRDRLDAALDAGHQASAELYAEALKDAVKALLRAQIEAEAG